MTAVERAEMENQPRQRVRGVQRRQQIIAEASKAFAASGFRGTSLADVAARVGVSQPGLLHHYPNKEALILAVLEQRDTEDHRYLTELFGESEPSVVEWLAALCDRNAHQPELVRLFTVTAAESVDPTHPAHEFFRRRNERTRATVAARIIADQEKGRLPRHLDPALTAAELVALMNGLQLQWLMHPSVEMYPIYRAALDRLTAAGR